MGSRSGKEVDFQRLADALADYRFAYLVTVDDDYRVHTVTVEPELRDRVIAVGLITSPQTTRPPAGEPHLRDGGHPGRSTMQG